MDVGQRQMNWYKNDDEESLVGAFPLNVNDEGDYICPLCGQVATAWEGQVDEDRMGNAIRGWSYDCYPCGIYSEIEETDY